MKRVPSNVRGNGSHYRSRNACDVGHVVSFQYFFYSERSEISHSDLVLSRNIDAEIDMYAGLLE